MNKNEVVSVLSQRTNLSKARCEQVLKEFRNLIFEECNKGEEVRMRNFGLFKLKESKARKFINPQTHRYYISNPKRQVVFKQSKTIS